MKCNHWAETMAARGARGAETKGILSLVSILAVLGVLGCGSGSGERTATASGEGPGTPVEPFTAVAPASTDAALQVASLGSSLEAVQADSLPPDVAALAADSLASPGETVEIAAQASADVVEVFLWDGIGRKQSFAYDSTAGVWRASYRVPLGISSDRIGLSVTAKNSLDLRHRVWVFLRIEPRAKAEQPATQPEAQAAPNTGW